MFQSDMDLSDADVQRHAEADRREVDPPIQVETATWSQAGQLDWWVKERQRWWGRVRGANGRQRWIKAADLRPASDSQRSGYVALTALAVNIVVAVLLTLVLRALKVGNGTDITVQSDYFADVGDPGVQRTVDESQPIH